MPCSKFSITPRAADCHVVEDVVKLSPRRQNTDRYVTYKHTQTLMLSIGFSSYFCCRCPNLNSLVNILSDWSRATGAPHATIGPPPTPTTTPTGKPNRTDRTNRQPHRPPTDRSVHTATVLYSQHTPQHKTRAAEAAGAVWQQSCALRGWMKVFINRFVAQFWCSLVVRSVVQCCELFRGKTQRT